jgi:hypothetical protein
MGFLRSSNGSSLLARSSKSPLVSEYNRAMARGWESKSVEAQQEDAGRKLTPEKPRLTREEAGRLQRKESLRLSLQRVVQELKHSQNTRHRTMLQQAQADLQRRIAELDA